MAERYETVDIIESGEVEKYFPENISELFGTGNNTHFFGLVYDGGYKNGEEKVAKSRSLYLAVTYDMRQDYPSILDNCDMRESHSKWIRIEGYDFTGLREMHEELAYHNPLLILYLSSHLIKEDKNFIFTELLRYADHEQLRGRGIATQVFESVCDKCRADGQKYIYVDDQSTGWPSQSKLIGVRWLPEEMFDEICDAYYDKPKEDVFNVPMSRNMVRVLDDDLNNELHQKMLERMNAEI